MSRKKKIGKASIFTIIGGLIGAAIAEGFEFVAIGALTTGAAGIGAAAAPVLITAGAVGGLATFGLQHALKKEKTVTVHYVKWRK